MAKKKVAAKPMKSYLALLIRQGWRRRMLMLYLKQWLRKLKRVSVAAASVHTPCLA